MKTKKIATKKATKKVAKKATKKVSMNETIATLVETAGKGLAKIENQLTNLVLAAFPNREYVRHANSGVSMSAGNEDSYEYTYVFEVDESYYRITHYSGTGEYTIGPDELFDDNSVEISLTAKAIREAVEMFEREASGEEGDEERKYEFTGETKKVNGHTLHRIRAVRKITNPIFDTWKISVGDLGGWIESEKNLSHEGAAWVDNDACVYGDAKVYGNGYVGDHVQVYGNATVEGESQVYDDAKVYGNAKVFGNAWVYNTANVSGTAKVYDDANVFGNANVSGDAEVFGEAKVYGNAEVYGFAHVYGDAIVIGNAEVRGTATLHEGCLTEGTHGGEPEKSADPETEDTLKNRMAVLEGRVDTLASEMKATVKDIKDIKKKINK